MNETYNLGRMSLRISPLIFVILIMTAIFTPAVSAMATTSAMPVDNVDAKDALELIIDYKGGSFTNNVLVSYGGGKVSCGYSYDATTHSWKIKEVGSTVQKTISMNGLSDVNAGRLVSFIYYVDQLKELDTEADSQFLYAAGGVLCLAGAVCAPSGLIAAAVFVGGVALIVASVIISDQIEENKRECFTWIHFYYDKL